MENAGGPANKASVSERAMYQEHEFSLQASCQGRWPTRAAQFPLWSSDLALWREDPAVLPWQPQAQALWRSIAGILPQPTGISGIGGKTSFWILKCGFYFLLKICKQEEMREVTTSPKPGDYCTSVPNIPVLRLFLTQGEASVYVYSMVPASSGSLLGAGPCPHTEKKFRRENWACF